MQNILKMILQNAKQIVAQTLELMEILLLMLQVIPVTIVILQSQIAILV